VAVATDSKTTLVAPNVDVEKDSMGVGLSSFSSMTRIYEDRYRLLNLLSKAGEVAEEKVEELRKEGKEGKKVVLRVCSGMGYPKVWVETGEVGVKCNEVWREPEG